MALSREQIVDAAMTILRSYGLASLSMRNLAKNLGVQPGALYWHVKSKQDLLVLLAERILATTPAWTDQVGARSDRADARQAALDIRTALTSVKDGAEVVSVAQALNPRQLAPLQRLRDTLPANLTLRQAEWGVRALTHYILGAVAEEQTHAELILAGVAANEESTTYTTEAFIFGVDAFLRGLGATAPPHPAP
ncbi:TetR family transcriptional regulator [Cryobacterium sp. TMS1-13-1]|uniref:TetR family transcriptional regulator n=1 Tax=Cryobacterium sp. TMS1-13-1 TaxID=1259220 RepID=UPI00106D1B74|nr:TetR family transcriptional regulator [Cryobacterium sp. TMS1-13-1]TFD21477.1 TetR family transcriptional regulator [Cryobacterium sp. TMS1-13-1]